jgi:hypothetical protein
MSFTALADLGEFSYRFSSKACVLDIFLNLFSRYFWEILMMVTFGLTFILIPYEVSFCYGQIRFLDSKNVRQLIFVIGKHHYKFLKKLFP